MGALTITRGFFHGIKTDVLEVRFLKKLKRISFYEKKYDEVKKQPDYTIGVWKVKSKTLIK